MFRPKSRGSVSSKSSFASKIAHTSTIPALGNKDLRLLQDLILNEKTVLTTLQKLAGDLSRASESLRAWGLGEGEDLGDVLSHATGMYAHITTALNNFANHHHDVRAHLKAIRTREEQLDELRRKRKNVAGKADAAEKKLSKMLGENKNLPAQTDLLNRLREEIRQLDTEIMVEEAKLGDFKRLSTRNFMALKLGGLLEFGEKATIIGELGKLLIEEIPLDPTPPGQNRPFFQGQTRTSDCAAEAARCIGEVVFSAPAEAKLSTDAYALPAGGGGSLIPPIDEIRRSSEDGRADVPYGGQGSDLRVTNNYATPSSTLNTNANTTTSIITSGIDGLPPSEFGESTSRRFGVNTTGSGSSPSTGTGGQFSTFPVKARSNTASSTGGLSFGGDFGSNVTGALGLGENKDSNTTNNNGGPPSVTVSGTPWDGSTSTFDPSHNRAQSQESTYLAYNAPAEPQPMGSGAVTSEAGSMLNVEKGVRFRTPSMEVSGMQPIAPGVASPTYPGGRSGWRTGGYTGVRSSNDVPPLSPPPEDPEDSDYNQSQTQYAYQYRSEGQVQVQGTPRSQAGEEYYNPYEEYSQGTPISPNPYDRHRDETISGEKVGPDHATLNIAASREIARELDALQGEIPPNYSVAPPSPSPTRSSYQQPSQPPASVPAPVRPLEIHHRAPSPYAPQAPLVQGSQGRSISPNPPSAGSGGYFSPTEASNTSRPPWAGNYSRGSPLPTSNSELYSTPPEYPSPSPQFSQPQSGSTPSPTSGGAAGGGPRTITASAFKRRPGALPSSPYPASRQPPPHSVQSGAQGQGQQEAGSPVMSDYGTIGGTRITNANPAGDE